MCIKGIKNILSIENNAIMASFSNMFCIVCFVYGFVMANSLKPHSKVKGIFELHC